MSAKTYALDYDVDLDAISRPDAFNFLDIVAKDLDCASFYGDSESEEDNWDVFLVSFFKRLAELGHFERLRLIFPSSEQSTSEQVSNITKAFVDAIKANSNLVYLHIVSESHRSFDWTPHLQDMFEAIEEHPGLRTLVVQRYPPVDADYSLLKRLLLGNRNIVVLDRAGERCSDGSSIDDLYALNPFYHGSKDLAKESSSLRTNLVATTLVESASENYQRTAVLLSSCEDVLFELVQNMIDDEDDVSQSVSEEAEPPASLCPDAKRVRRS